jgi:hypothetical protein
VYYKNENYAGSEKPLPILFKEKESLVYYVLWDELFLLMYNIQYTIYNIQYTIYNIHLSFILKTPVPANIKAQWVPDPCSKQLHGTQDFELGTV